MKRFNQCQCSVMLEEAAESKKDLQDYCSAIKHQLNNAFKGKIQLWQQLEVKKADYKSKK